MGNKRIQDLPADTAPQATDFVAIEKDTGAGTFATSKMTLPNLFNGLVGGGIDSVAASSTTDLSTSSLIRQSVTGTGGPITNFGTGANLFRILYFTSAIQLTHNSVSLILLGGVNRITKAGAVGVYASDGSGNWQELSYFDQDVSSGSVPTFLAANISGQLGAGGSILSVKSGSVTKVTGLGPGTSQAFSVPAGKAFNLTSSGFNGIIAIADGNGNSALVLAGYYAATAGISIFGNGTAFVASATPSAAVGISKSANSQTITIKNGYSSTVTCIVTLLGEFASAVTDPA